MVNYEEIFKKISRRYSNIEPEALEAVLSPMLIPISRIDIEVRKLPGQSHWHATFEIDLSDEWLHLLHRGTTGKFVPASFSEGGAWREICKGRIISVDVKEGKAYGEIYTGKKKSDLILALAELKIGDYLEVDQYGASAKVLSSLSEYYLAKQCIESGYIVKRMPEDTAKHLGAYYNYDFEFEKNGEIRKVEVKSLWGTNTDYARLIHSTTSKPKGDEGTWTPEHRKNYYPTSSCKFETQDIFAVSMFLRTGNIKEFAFARSVSKADKLYGLPFAPGFPNHVNQNPLCRIGDGSWFASIDEVWDLE